MDLLYFTSDYHEYFCFSIWAASWAFLSFLTVGKETVTQDTQRVAKWTLFQGVSHPLQLGGPAFNSEYNKERWKFLTKEYGGSRG